MSPSKPPPQVLDKFVKRARRLYSLPAVAMQVIELTGQPTVETRALKDCIENDPALTGKILRVVNSSLFGLSRQVTDLNQALALLGIKPLKLLVLGFSLPPALLSDVEAEVLSRYWRHTLIKAVAAREISELVWDVQGDEAFIAGLLQDIGMLALIQDLGDAYVRFLDRVHGQAGDLAIFETDTLGFDHAVLSARLLDHWGLPQPLVRAVAMPRDEQRLLALPDDEQALPQILHLAELMALFLTQRRAALLNELLDIGRQYHDLSATQVESLIASLEQKVPQLAEVLSLQLPGDTNYSSVLMQAYTQLSEAADAVTAELFGDGRDAEALLQEARALSGAVERFVGQPMYSREESAHIATGSRCSRSAATAIADDGQASAARSAAATRVKTDPGLFGHVASAVSKCRKARCAVSLALMEVDDYQSLILRQGTGGAAQTIDQLKSAMESELGGEGRLLMANDVRFALILENYDRQQGVELARHLVKSVREWSLQHARHGRLAVSISAGLATLAMPPKSFPPHELIEAAERCLNGVQLSGGDSVKSIDIY